MAACIVGVKKVWLEIDAANAVVATAIDANVKAPPRLAILYQAVLAARLVVAKICSDTMLGTGLAVLREALARIASCAILKSDC